MKTLNNKFNKLTGFEKFQLSVLAFIGSTLTMTVISWVANGFVTTL